MNIALRLTLVLIAMGAGLGLAGYQEFQVGNGASEQAQPVALEEIEAGRIPDNTHLEIGSHWRMYQQLVFRWESESGEATSEPPASAKVEYAYYPIVSDSHPFFSEVRKLAASYGRVDAIPEPEFPVLERFAVLVKTKQFGTVGELPEPAWSKGELVKGLVVNRIHTLSGDERDLIAQGFPKLPLASVLILEEGRQPASAGKAFGLMGGGAGLGLAGVAIILVGRRRASAPSARMPTATPPTDPSVPHRPPPIG